jgi:hypothetical protein
MRNVDGLAVRLVDATDDMLAVVLPDRLAVRLGGIAEACQGGPMAVAVGAGPATGRCFGAGLLEAERKFRRRRGYRQMPQLAAALTRHAEAVTSGSDTDANSIAA